MTLRNEKTLKILYVTKKLINEQRMEIIFPKEFI